MDTISLQQLKTAARNATKGKWCFAKSGSGDSIVKVTVDSAYKSLTRVALCKLPRAKWRGELQTAHDGIFISLANPERVTALIESLEEAQAHVAELEDFNRDASQLIADLTRNLHASMRRTVTAKLPKFDGTEDIAECVSKFIQASAAAGIKWEAE